jgi:hypothetical protein
MVSQCTLEQNDSNGEPVHTVTNDSNGEPVHTGTK